MQLSDYLEFLAPDDVRLKGHRIGLVHVVERYRDGMSAEQIALDFPGVGLEQIYAVIAYYLHHQGEVDASIARLREMQEAHYQQAKADPDSLVRQIRERLTQQA